MVTPVITKCVMCNTITCWLDVCVVVAPLSPPLQGCSSAGSSGPSSCCPGPATLSWAPVATRRTRSTAAGAWMKKVRCPMDGNKHVYRHLNIGSRGGRYSVWVETRGEEPGDGSYFPPSMYSTLKSNAGPVIIGGFEGNINYEWTRHWPSRLWPYLLRAIAAFEVMCSLFSLQSICRIKRNSGEAMTFFCVYCFINHCSPAPKASPASWSDSKWTIKYKWWHHAV